MPVIDRSGQKFGRLTAINCVGLNKQQEALWECRCECGGEKIVPGAYLSNGSTRSCGCLRKNVNRKWPQSESQARHRFGHYQLVSEKADREFLLSFEQFLSLCKSNCFYCGQPPGAGVTRTGTAKSYALNGIDRVDNKIGYRIENCVPCCELCNRFKGVLTDDLFIGHCILIAKYQGFTGGGDA